ncbi:SEL1-like repeat protein [Luteolibacter ambystomatis]|uniref:SEL1-like repeat protein n=1 Tax=Luteolibacter ambystomatis TaxID=2824561 RepID=A0A975IXV8_9BACT|nr:SEL1-like repeat protein [Luteolibacter ambystomatis]QUE49592.1 SEL1-like repeat protein [Luteolibacter ambystomatis]
MRLKTALLSLLVAWSSVAVLSAAVSMPVEPSTGLNKKAEGPAKEALEAFKDGRHAKAIELAKPLAEQGNGDALYLMGFAHESGQGAEASKEKALEYYKKAAATGQKDATYRMSFILLASEDEKERTQGREALENAAKDDPAVAGRILGEAWLRGRLSKEPDYDKVVFWWSRAADAGDPPSLMLLARLYEGQFGFPDKKDLKKANDTYRKAAGLGDAGAMVALGSRLLNGAEAQRNEKEGREWIKKALEAKEYSGYLALGDFEENVKKDPKAALETYRKGDDAGQVDCTLRTAQAYLEGKGTEKDEDRGLKLLEKAATAGSAPAHLRLAVTRLSKEKPTPDDIGIGYGHLLSAAAGGLSEAQNELALFYLSQKLGGVADPVAAVAWLTRAAQGGFAPAQNNLATMYERGAGGVQQNMANAGQLYALAANQGHGPATYALARLFATGTGIKQDLPKAWALATLAAERKQEEGAKLAKELDDKFTPEQKAEGKKALEDIKSDKPAAPKADAKGGDAPKPKPAAGKP